ncbi:MAG: HEAT repeat domain-containing protein [Planctomycetes bacterium]|nr:HEAT repeat domain-containing protein [Planctomycetota bacterium]MCB9903536.1 HEAT repeat domain-containing protein [Planctomycetota bacterium]
MQSTFFAAAAASALAALAWSPAPAPRVADIQWRASQEAALEEAKASNRVLFLAVNMDGERANDELANKTYGEKSIVGLSLLTVNLVASAFEHSSGKCSRFHGITCADHMACDVWARESILQKDEEGFVIAPQHVWLAPTGEVLLSVPYAVTEGELEWCFGTAIAMNDPSAEIMLSSKARAPRRLVKGGVAKPDTVGPAGAGALTRDEVLALIEEVKRGMNQEQRARAVNRIMTADEPEAIEFVRTELRSGGGNARGGGGRGGGGRGGGGGGGRNSEDRRPAHLRTMGTVSPSSYWEVAVEYVDDSILEVRAEAVVALEMLASPDSVRDLQAALKKEKDDTVRKNILRALGTAGATDKKVHALLEKAVLKEKDEIIRRNATLALGSLAQSPSVDALLTDILQDEERTHRERAAAVCAMALTRRSEWLELLRPALRAAQAAEAGETPEGEPEGFVPTDDLLAALQAAVQLLEGGDLSVLKDAVSAAGRDTIPRERWFGRERRR